MLDDAAPVFVSQSTRHGRGLFAARSFSPGETIGVYPILILSIEEVRQIRGTRIYDYLFFVDEDESEQMRAAVAFGPISMCNHDADANAGFTLDAESRTVILSAATAIAAEDEIFINYEEFADDALSRR